jgi:hypothetical protein
MLHLNLHQIRTILRHEIRILRQQLKNGTLPRIREQEARGQLQEYRELLADADAQLQGV